MIKQNMTMKKYTNARDYLGKEVKVKMDRPLHAKHPKHGWEYELNYGFVPDTKSPDGEELDAYVIGVDEPVDEFEGICVAIIHRTDDDDDKLIVVTPEQKDISDEEIRKKTCFQEQWFTSVIIR